MLLQIGEHVVQTAAETTLISLPQKAAMLARTASNQAWRDRGSSGHAVQAIETKKALCTMLLDSGAGVRAPTLAAEEDGASDDRGGNTDPQQLAPDHI